MRIVALSVAATLAVLAGCQVSPRPAITEVKPGESKFKAERESKQPSETVVRIHGSTAPLPPAPPVFRIIIVLPPPVSPAPAQEPEDGGK